MSGSLAPVDPPIRLGLIGAGLAAQKLHWPALVRLPERFTLTGVADPSRPNAEAFAALAGLPMTAYTPDNADLLRRDDVDAVVVAVPIDQLLAVATDVVAAGKHLLCEKPAGIDLAEGQAFMRLAEEHPRQVILMGENVFYRDEVRLARALIDQGAIGQPRLVAQRWLRQLLPIAGEFSGTPWRLTPAYRGGILLDGGVHGIAAIRMLGGEITNVAARASRVNATMDSETMLTMTFDLACGAVGECTWGFFDSPVPASAFDTQVIGDAGSLVVGHAHLRQVLSDGQVVEHRVERGDGGFYNQYRDLYDAITAGTPVTSTVSQTVENMRVILTALEVATQENPGSGAPAAVTGVPLWRPRGAIGLFDGLPITVHRDDVAG